MSLFLLGSSSYRGELALVGEVGVEFTHLASISLSDGTEPIRAFVKIYPFVDGESSRSHRGLVNELVSHFCAEKAQLNVPPRAGLILLEQNQLPASSPVWLLNHPRVLGWWSEDVGHPSLKASWNIQALPEAAKHAALDEIRELLRSNTSTSSIVAFDALLANVDRNLGNLLSDSQSLTLIDHGRALTGPLWLSTDLFPESEYRNVIAQLLGDEVRTLPFRFAVSGAFNNMAGRILPGLDELKRLLSHLIAESDVDAAHDFLRRRGSASSLPGFGVTP